MKFEGYGTSNGVIFTKEKYSSKKYDNYIWISYDYFDESKNKGDTNRYMITGMAGTLTTSFSP